MMRVLVLVATEFRFTPLPKIEKPQTAGTAVCAARLCGTDILVVSFYRTTGEDARATNRTA